VRAEVVVTVQMAAETEATEVTVAEADAAMVVETMRTDSNNQQSGSDSGRDRGRGGSGGGSVVAVVIRNPRMGLHHSIYDCQSGCITNCVPLVWLSSKLFCNDPH